MRSDIARCLYLSVALLTILTNGGRSLMAAEPAVRAVDFESRKIYQSAHHPSYTSWVSFFPGEHGQWYLTCEKVTRPAQPLPQCTPQQWYEMSLPVGYDKSQYRMEIVMLESRDNMETWKVTSRQPVRFHHSAGSFAQARTKDGRFLRFLWSCYSLDPSVKPNEVFYQSTDDGETWEKMAPFHDPHFISSPHRLRTLRDGTMVLCAPLQPVWGEGTDRPTRGSSLNVVSQMQMTLHFSHDQGRTWQGPLPLYGGQNVSETDFVELPSGDLLFFNNSIFSTPGRQFVYRRGKVFSPGPLERVISGTVPETVCLTGDGILVGCMRAGSYHWSDDLGQTWQGLQGTAGNGEVYQPWIQCLDDGRIACAGHLGADDPIGERDQYISIHFFRLEVRHKTTATRLTMERDYDAATGRWPNAYTLTLTSDGQPLADKEVTFQYTPGKHLPLPGETLTLRTDVQGKAHVALPDAFDEVEDRHAAYTVRATFNADRTDPDFKPARAPSMHFYALAHRDPPLQPIRAKGSAE